MVLVHASCPVYAVVRSGARQCLVVLSGAQQCLVVLSGVQRCSAVVPVFALCVGAGCGCRISKPHRDLN